MTYLRTIDLLPGHVKSEQRVVDSLVANQVFEVGRFTRSRNGAESHTENTRVGVSKEVLRFLIDGTEILAHDAGTGDLDIVLSENTTDGSGSVLDGKRIAIGSVGRRIRRLELLALTVAAVDGKP